MSSFKDKAQTVYDAMMALDRQQDQLEVIEMALKDTFVKGGDDYHHFLLDTESPYATFGDE